MSTAHVKPFSKVAVTREKYIADLFAAVPSTWVRTFVLPFGIALNVSSALAD
jgi:hypothetical protein